MHSMLGHYSSVSWLIAAALCGHAVACSSDNDPGNTGSGGGSPDSSTSGSGGGGTNGTGGAGGGQGGGALSDGTGGPSYTYTLIDDMETTTHGPIEFTGVMAPLNPGYWFNFGAGVSGDTATPPILSFAFTMLPTARTLMGKTSNNAAHQACSLNGQYDVCGLGFEFAQVPLEDGGTETGTGAAADASSESATNADVGPPMMTVPFDISGYKGISFWGKAEIDSGTLDVKVQFPDTDTDPRGIVCNGPPAGIGNPMDVSRCYNSYAVHLSFTSEWQQFTVLFSNLAIDPTFGFQQPAPFTAAKAEAGQDIGSKNVYGVNWQGQKNSIPDAGVVGIDFWVDDVYFIQ